MASTVKRKIRLGTLFLFVLVLLSCGLGIFNLVRLKNDATRILKNNYESLDYCHSMQRILDSSINSQGLLVSQFDSILKLQERNITEPGEKQATSNLRKYFDLYRSGDRSSARDIRSGIQHILGLNMTAIELKNEKATQTANNALTYISFLATIIFLVGF